MAALLASIPSPDRAEFEIGPVSIHAYGLMLLLAIAAAVVVTGIRWSRRGGDWDLVYRVAVWGVAAGIVGARAYHVATSWNEVPDEWWGVFAVWEGGLGVWGGIALGTLVGAWIVRRGIAERRRTLPEELRRIDAEIAAADDDAARAALTRERESVHRRLEAARHHNVFQFMDAVAPGLLLAQAIGRWGNWWNQELFGGPTDLPWALEIDPENRPDDYLAEETFHPTFLYEFLWNVAMVGVLLLVERIWRIRPPALFALYVALYCLGRFFEELLRVDPAHELGPLRLNAWVSIVLFLLAGGFFVWWQIVRPRRRRHEGQRPEQRRMAIPKGRVRASR